MSANPGTSNAARAPKTDAFGHSDAARQAQKQQTGALVHSHNTNAACVSLAVECSRCWCCWNTTSRPASGQHLCKSNLYKVDPKTPVSGRRAAVCCCRYAKRYLARWKHENGIGFCVRPRGCLIVLSGFGHLEQLEIESSFKNRESALNGLPANVNRGVRCKQAAKSWEAG